MLSIMRDASYYFWVLSMMLLSSLIMEGKNADVYGFEVRSVATRSSKFWRKADKRKYEKGLRMSDSSNNGMDAGALGSALVRLDREWQKSQALVAEGRFGEGNTWRRMDLVKDSSDESKSSSNEFVYVLEPSTTPSCLIVFTGGAVLGQFPHIAYSEFLKVIASRLNASIIAAPYQVGLDHFALAKQTGELLRKAIIQCEDATVPGYQDYRTDLPKFFLGHSLGCKLQTISMAATNIDNDLDGVGFLCYNNFGFSDTISMAKSFAQQFQDSQSSSSSPQQPFGMDNDMFQSIFNFAEQAIGVVGLEFNPSPNDTYRIISNKYSHRLQSKTRFFVFDDDDLDNTYDFINACPSDSPSSIGSDFDDNNYGNENSYKKSLSVSNLPGTHLTPVYLKIAIDDFDIPQEAQYAVSDFTNNVQQISFGSENQMNQAALEVCDWILGKRPSRTTTKSQRTSRTMMQISPGGESFENQ